MTTGILKQSHVLTKRAPFSAASMSRTPANTWGWLATTPDHPAADATEPADEVEGPQVVVLEEVAAVQDGPDQLLHVVGLVRGGRYQFGQLGRQIHGVVSHRHRAVVAPGCWPGGRRGARGPGRGTTFRPAPRSWPPPTWWRE